MIIKGWEFSSKSGFTGSAKGDKVAVKAHERSCYAKGGKVEGKSATPPPRPQKHFDRMENFRKERDAEPASPATETAGMKKGGKWIAGAIKKPGALKKELGVKKGDKIPAKKLDAAAKKGGKEGQRARLAKTMRKFAEGGSVSKNLAPDSKLGIPGGDGTKNVVGFKKGGKTKSKGGGAAQKAAGALAQIAAAASQQGPPGGAMGGPQPPMALPPGIGGPTGGAPPGMRKGGKSKKK